MFREIHIQTTKAFGFFKFDSNHLVSSVKDHLKLTLFHQERIQQKHPAASVKVSPFQNPCPAFLWAEVLPNCQAPDMPNAGNRDPKTPRFRPQTWRLEATRKLMLLERANSMLLMLKSLWEALEAFALRFPIATAGYVLSCWCWVNFGVANLGSKTEKNCVHPTCSVRGTSKARICATGSAKINELTSSSPRLCRNNYINRILVRIP